MLNREWSKEMDLDDTHLFSPRLQIHDRFFHGFGA